MSVSDPAGAVWRKSSHSGAGNDCVEIALAETEACVAGIAGTGKTTEWGNLTLISIDREKTLVY